jgi:predicted PurR-regulated permease PerM
MSEGGFNVERFQRAFLLMLVVGISLAFLVMVQGFLSALLLAAIATGMCHPIYLGILARVGGREGLASTITILIVLFVIIGPLLGFFAIVAGQALEVGESMRPWVTERVTEIQAGDLSYNFDLPEALQPYEAQIASQAGKIASRATQILFEGLSSATRGTAQFALGLFVMLYAMFFFLRDGPAMLRRILYYVPLKSEDENRMVMKFVSVSRATIKGTMVIGVVQGSLAGIAFAVVGIEGAAFWATVMAVLSIIPGVGTALVWIPAAISLYVGGDVTASIGLSLWCIAVVGTVDNVLRPRLVGRDTEMSDLLILLSTLGGLLLFGAIGIAIGPILAALFVTVWELYGEAFAEYLPDVEGFDLSED